MFSLLLKDLIFSLLFGFCLPETLVVHFSFTKNYSILLHFVGIIQEQQHIECALFSMEWLEDTANE